MPFEILPGNYDEAPPPDVPQSGMPARGFELLPVDAGASGPPVPQRSTGQELLRQAGLTGRYLAEGAMGLPNMPFDVMVKLWNRLTGSSAETSTEAQARLMKQAGVPEPETATERIAGNVSRFMVSAGVPIGIAESAIAAGFSPVARAVAERVASNSGTQLASAVTGGTAGGIAHEMGASPGAQFAIELAGGAAPSLAFVPAAVRAGRTPGLSPEAADRAAAMAAVGVDNPPTAAVTRSPQEWVDWTELGKREGPARDLYVERGEQANQALTDVLPSMRKGPESTPYQQAEAARTGVAAYEADARNVASGTYQAAAKAPGADAPFPAAAFWEKAAPVLETYEDSLPGVVKKRLQEFQAGDLADQGQIPAASGAAPRVFTVGEASKLYQLINDTTGSAVGPARAAGGALKAALADAGSIMGGDPGSAMQLFKDATQQWRTMKTTLAPAPIKTLSKATDAKPEFFAGGQQGGSLFTTRSPGEIGSLYGLLKENVPASADAMHDALLDYLQDQATKAANGRFSGAALGKAIDRIGPERMSTILSQPELRHLGQLRTAADALTTEPNLAAVNRSNTASTLLNRLGRLTPEKLAILGELIGEHIGVPGAGSVLGYGLGNAGEKMSGIVAGRRMAGKYGVPPTPPSLEELFARRALPWLTGASAGSIAATNPQ
jgi:hypothetical protein